jgi:hypothetical protein
MWLSGRKAKQEKLRSMKNGANGKQEGGGEDTTPSPAPPAPPPPPALDVWQTGDNPNGVKTHYVIRHPWQWVMHEIATPGMEEVMAPSELPLSKAAAAVAQSLAAAAAVTNTPSTPATRRRRNQKKSNKNTVPATFRLNICSGSGDGSSSSSDKVELAIHGTSSAIDGLEDKDELFRTLQRCRCDQLNLSPPSILVSWDVTHEECLNVVGKKLPSLEMEAAAADGDATTLNNKVAVLKEPMGSQGKGIYFVKNAEEIFSIIDEQHQRAMKEPQFLDNLIEAKGRIPSWGE